MPRTMNEGWDVIKRGAKKTAEAMLARSFPMALGSGPRPVP